MALLSLLKTINKILPLSEHNSFTKTIIRAFSSGTMKSSKEQRRRKGLCESGPVHSQDFIYVEQELMKNKICNRLDKGEYCILVSPGQTGKTSVVVNSVIPMLQEKGYFPLLIDLRGVVANFLEHSYCDKKITLAEALMKVINYELMTNYEGYLNVSSIFRIGGKISELKEEKIILLFDDIDSIGELPHDVRERFLNDLSTMKKNRELYCIHSCLGITNWVGEYLGQTIGISPFNISNPIDGEYFTKSEAYSTWDSYENESVKRISTEVRSHIYDLTQGAQGQLVILTLYYGMLCGENLDIEEEHWLSSLLKNEFWKHINQFQNFIRITSIIQDSRIAKYLLEFMKDSTQSPSIEIAYSLIKSNILKKNEKLQLVFVSPLVQQFVFYTLVVNRKYEITQNTISETNFLDFLPTIIKSMNRLPFIAKDCAHFSSTYPNEILYQISFDDAIKQLFGTGSKAIIEENQSKSQTIQQYNSLISIDGNKILIEHCCSQAHYNSIGYQKLQENEKRKTYIFHWISEANEGNFQYQFPTHEKDLFSIIYIFHDPFFSKVEIVARDTTTKINIPIEFLPFKDRRIYGKLEVNGIILNKYDCTEWSEKEIFTILESSKSDNGVGLGKDYANTIKLLGFHFELIISSLIEQREKEDCIQEVSSKLVRKGLLHDYCVSEAIVRWVFTQFI